ncbi:MAG: alpha-2-macroglobulin [Mediterranea sp.]|jgi:hypothetical protein|nr:alpha-2-macroglobulin [Mediterranea sp.]
MKIKNICVALWTGLCMLSAAANAQSYDKLWKAVENAQQRGLPQQAITYAEEIFRRAEAEKNPGQMLKAYTARTSYRQLIAPDSFYVDLKGLEQWASAAATPGDRAVLHTLVAQAYSDYAARNRWKLLGRTDVAGDAPEDIRQWSGGMFIRKILDHTRAALKDPELLSGLSSGTYVPFVEQQATSRYFGHTMYHLLSSYAIRSLKAVSMLDKDSVAAAVWGIYSDLKRTYIRQGNRDAQALLALEELEWRRTVTGVSSDTYLKCLDILIEAYGDREVCAEIYLGKARELIERRKKTEAFELCREAMLKYPKYERIRALEELQEQIRRPFITATMSDRAYPEDTIRLRATHANLDGFTVHYYKVDLPATAPELRKTIDKNFYKKYARKKVRSERFPLVRPAGYLQRDTVLKLAAPQVGIYAVQIVPDGKGAPAVSWLLSVTSLKLLSINLPERQTEMVVVDAKSGRPVEGATVRLFTGNEGEPVSALTVKTQAGGQTEAFRSSGYTYVTAEKSDDTSFLPQRLHGGYYGASDGRTEKRHLTLLTDRSIYRPGQTVYVKGVAHSQSADTAHVIAGAKYTLTLFDGGGREIARKEAATSEFGSLVVEFVLPSGGLNGSYTIRTGEGESASIRVEEYKRPSFEITIDRTETAYRLNDSISVKGAVKTYSGIPVQNRPAQYTVARSLFGWRGVRFGSEATIDSGEASLNDAGEFTLPVVLKTADASGPDQGFYTFTVYVTVTDAAGETQTAATTFGAGKRSLLLSANIPEHINKEEDIKLTFRTTNLSFEPVAVEGLYKLYRYSDHATKTLAEAPACTGTFTSNTETAYPQWKSLPTGYYKLMLTACDDQGRESGHEATVILFSAADKRPATRIGLWYYPLNTDFDAAHPGEFLFGTSEKDACVFVDAFSGNKRIESRSLHLSDTVVRFTYPYRPEYGDGLAVTFCYVKNGEARTQKVTFRKRLPDKELKLSWSVFRDKLRPGQQEEWKLTVRNPDGSPADAELLAIMYDASLDKLWKRQQSLRLTWLPHWFSVGWSQYRANTNHYAFRFAANTLKVPAIAYDLFRTEPFGPAALSRTLAEKAYTVGAGAIAQEASIFHLYPSEANDKGAPATVTEDLRTDFAETAFFYPQLRTNENGEAAIAFTVPESLTRWNISGYAHTKGMLTGMIDSEAVTSKTFMLTPNLPRFVRVGDRTSIASSVANLAAAAITGQAVLTLFDPLTEKTITTLKQTFTVEAGKTTAVDFLFTATEEHNLLGCRLVARGGNFSDGEQHLLPVLSRKEQITESIAMPVRGNQTREFPLNNLFNNNSKTATGRSLTVEFSGNPAWYAVQALPSLSLPADDNAVSWATAYYANTLATHIINSQPRLKTIFDTWKEQGGTKTFLANLQKNQDLKQILLEETPWAMEAATEQEQIERLATLFDRNNIRNNTLTALNKLESLQLSNGAWAWYKGMTASPHITTYVMRLLVRLRAMTGQPADPEADAMYRRAFAFLHQKALDEYETIRKAGQKGISDAALQYLYCIALAGETVPETNRAAYNYFLARTKEVAASRNITKKALAAIVLHKSGHATEAQALAASLKEYAVQTDGHGLHFAFNEDPCSWEGLKVPAHVTAMEALDIAGGHPETLEEMKLWLLKEKQVRQWNSPVATADAIYALLLRGADPTRNQGDVRITYGGKTIETLSPATPAIPEIAYVKETVTDERALSKPQKIIVEKRDAGIAWGAVYAQYEEETANVAPHGKELSIERTLYIERTAGSKKELIPIAAGTPLEVGGKVVSRIVVKLDRTMDFVQLKDRRAACFEPAAQLSGYTWSAGTGGYYVALKDASTHFYFHSLPKGVHVLEHSYRISRAGTYESGLATIQSAYAPEYAAHAPSVKLKVGK